MFELGGIGDQLRQLVTAVRATDGARVPAVEWVDLVGQAQEAMNALAAVQTVALAQLAATEEEVESYRGLGHHRLDAPDLVSAQLGLTASAAAARVATAVDLATRHAPVIEAMAGGRLDGWRASVVSEELADAGPDTCGEVLARVGDTLGTEPAGLLRRRLRRTAFGLGVDEWSARLPVERSRSAWSVVDSLARSYLTDGRCERIEQARADALLDLIHARATGKLSVHLTVPAGVLAGAGEPNDDSATDSHTTVSPMPDDAPFGDGSSADGYGEALVPVTGFGTAGITHVRASRLASLAGGGASSAGATSVAACADDTGALATLPVPTQTDRRARRRAWRTARRRTRRLAQLKTRLQALRNTTGSGMPTAGIEDLEPYRPPE